VTAPHLNYPASGWGAGGLALLGLSVALYLGRPVLIPATIALLLACMLWPAVRWLHEPGLPLFGWRLRVPWPVASAAAVSVLLLAVAVTAVAFGLLIPRFVESLPTDPDKAQDYYARFRDRVERLSPVPLDDHYLPEDADKSALVAYLRNALDPSKPQFVVETLKNVLGLGALWLWQSVLILFTLFFFLLEGRMLSRRIVEVFGPRPEARARAVAALKVMGEDVRTYLVWRTAINVVMALLLGLVYYFAGLSQPGTWAMVTAVLLYVPYLGTILAGLPPILDALLSCPSPWVAVWLAIFYMGVTTVEGYFLVPLVMGRSMELNATTVMLSCLYWDLVWGGAGLFLAMPVMAALKTVCGHVPGWGPWANLMDTRQGPDRDDAPSPFEDFPPQREPPASH
jgi:predicted PurR-regulated permease PerM